MSELRKNRRLAAVGGVFSVALVCAAAFCYVRPLDAYLLKRWELELSTLADEDVELRLEQTEGRGMRRDAVAKGMTVRFRQGGEQLRPHGRRHTHSLKKLMQEAGIPPWQRNRIPLIYIEHQLACVCGLCVAEAFAVSAEQCGWTPVCRQVRPIV